MHPFGDDDAGEDGNDRVAQQHDQGGYEPAQRRGRRNIAGASRINDEPLGIQLVSFAGASAGVPILV